jgi:hypothetical protein
MLKHALLVIFFGLMIGGCASDEKMVSSGTSSSMNSGGEPAMSSHASAGESKSMNKSSSGNRIAAGAEEETLDTCLARIPKDATAGQKMLAEQTCRRDYAPRR